MIVSNKYVTYDILSDRANNTQHSSIYSSVRITRIARSIINNQQKNKGTLIEHTGPISNRRPENHHRYVNISPLNLIPIQRIQSNTDESREFQSNVSSLNDQTSRMTVSVTRVKRSVSLSIPTELVCMEDPNTSIVQNTIYLDKINIRNQN